jgi:protein-S-isoprenylcysteine O-methyltransferase Ste14
MKKITSTMVILAIMYLLPLSWAPALLASVKVLICFVAAASIFLSQPAMSVEEAKQKKAMDRNSIFAIVLGAMIGQIVAIAEWAYFLGEPCGIRNPIVAGIGLAMMVGGIAFRIWAIHTLGRFFTATVQIKDEHRVITSGPYKFVRHPSYLGAFVAIVGSGVFLEAPVGTLVSTVAMLIAYKIRIEVEEIALVGALGDSYRSYQKQTSRLIPCVW